MNTKWKMLAYAIALFLAGAVTGGLVGIKYARHSFNQPPAQAEVARMIRQHLGNRAGLTAGQLRAIDPFIEQTAARLEAIHSDTTQAINRVFSDFHTRIAEPGHLTATQKAILSQLEKEHAGPTKLPAGETTPAP